MDGSEFFKPESVYVIMVWNFLFWYFFSVALSELSCILAFGLSISCNFFSILFIHSALRLRSIRSHILLQNCFASLAFGCCYVFEYSPCFFRCFRMSCFVCIVWFYFGIVLVFLLSPLSSDLFPQIVSFVLIVLLCPFRPNLFSHFSFLFEFLLFVSDFLFVIPV